LTKKLKIFTFGLKQTYHNEKRLQTLLKFIKISKIDVVIDVRFNRGNRFRNWNCNGINIHNAIKQTYNGCCLYRALSIAGIPPWLRKKYAKDPRGMEHFYLNYLYENRELFLPYFLKYVGKNILLLCVENLKNPKTPYCHRIWLRDWLIAEGIAVKGNEEVLEK